MAIQVRPPSPALVRQYTCGDCSHLAHALHLRTGWPMVPMSGSHVMVRDDRGRYWDIYGPETEREATLRWGEPDEFDPWVSVPTTCDPDHLAVADALLAAHGSGSREDS